MTARMVKLSERIRSSLWVLPATCTLLAAALALLLIEIDLSSDRDLTAALPLLFRGGAGSAQTLLSTIAGSMITVAGTVYSLTFVVLVLASMQFAPRVLRRFMRDRSNQLVLGFFVATFTYCLIVLRSVRSSDEGEFVPHLAVTGGVILALISLGMLIYFIDHLSQGIQASSLIAGIEQETIAQINIVYPILWHETAAPPTAKTYDLESASWEPILSSRSGYLQYVDYATLLQIASKEDIIVREERLIGSFVIAGTPLVFVTPATRIRPGLQADIDDAFALGTNPTLQQDIAYGIRQIVDIGIKAISPAVNDPTTALNCIDHLGVILITLASRGMPDLDCRDANGTLRVIVRERTFSSLLRLAFSQLTHFGANDPVIVLRMLDTLTQVGTMIRNPEYRATLRQQMEKIVEAADRSIADPYEREAVRSHLQAAQQALGAPAQDSMIR